MTEVISQESLVLMAEEVISTLRSASEVTYIHNVKQYQDNIKSQYERFQFDAKHLLKSTKLVQTAILILWRLLTFPCPYSITLPPA